MAHVKHQKNKGNVSYQGQEYKADENGIIEVPCEAVQELISHGYYQHILDKSGAADEAPAANETKKYKNKNQ